MLHTDPELSHRESPIAEAAAKAGFDCSSWPKLKGLIDAVTAVTKQVSYPDRWTGPAAFKSKVYPDRWRPDLIRQQKGMLQVYRDAERFPSVPASVVSAAQIIKHLNHKSRGRENYAPAAASGSNREPLAIRPSNKRTVGDFIDPSSSLPKRAKTEQPASRNFIDLTQDEEPVEARFVPSRRQATRPALASSTNGATGPNISQKSRKNPRRVQQPFIHSESIGTMATIASKLRASAHAIFIDRETLRQRWEVDSSLKLQDVTDDLVELNQFFTRAEDGILAAIDVLENRLLPKV